MPLAISSYEALAALSDGPDLLNLAWTLDERSALAVDVAELVSRELVAEATGSQRYVDKYFVQDPYGEATLGGAVASYFGHSGFWGGVTCGAGVDSLLHALAQLTSRGTLYVIGAVYPDLPHWTECFGGRCVSAKHAVSWRDHVESIRATRASVVLVERPALIGAQIELAELGELCESIASQNAVVVVDESYANYYPPSFSAINIVANARNLAVLRGVSKGYWLGGLRLGYCVTPPALTERVRTFVPPMQASSISLRLARAVLELGDITAGLRSQLPKAKEKMTLLLGNADLATPAQSAEFVPYFFCDRLEAQTALMRRGVLGKSQPFWSPVHQSIIYKYRLSVPLSAERMELLRQRCTMTSAYGESEAEDG